MLSRNKLALLGFAIAVVLFIGGRSAITGGFMVDGQVSSVGERALLAILGSGFFAGLSIVRFFRQLRRPPEPVAAASPPSSAASSAPPPPPPKEKS